MLRHGLCSSTFLVPFTGQVSLLHTTQTSHHSVSNHLMSPVMAFPCYPSASPGVSVPSQEPPFGLRHSLAGSPTSCGRIEFVILPTGGSPPVASHPASRQRSYFRIQTGDHLSEEDFHLSILGALTGAPSRRSRCGLPDSFTLLIRGSLSPDRIGRSENGRY